MKEDTNTINYKWLTHSTGDPFADAGGYVIKYLSDNFPQKDIIDLIEYITKIYVNKWGSKLNTFFLNSTITQPSFKGEQKIKETISYFESLINETEKFEYGYCRITGEKTKLFRAGRDNTVMSGSGRFVNFHHSFQSGMMLSKEIIIRMFFMPFGVISVGGKIAIIQSNSDIINSFFIIKNCTKNMSCIASSISEEVLKSDFGIPSNALFNFIDDLFVNQLSETIENIHELSVALYHFTNFGASPEINLYKLPATVFQFYSTCQIPILKNDWQLFLLSHYSNSKLKGAKYNESTSEYDYIKKEEIQKITYNDYRTWRNIVLENLLKGNNILRLFLKWGINHKFSFIIVELYQKNINNMKQETLNKIKDLASFLTNNDEDSIKKTIKSLDSYKNAYELRRFFLKNVVAKNYKNGAKETIITMEELVYYLFPDDASWRDIRDILLFAIYQELHAKDLKIDVELLVSETENNND
ncbi:MAG: hypothetical protein RSC28_07020 [Bacteroidales bacterium]